MTDQTIPAEKIREIIAAHYADNEGDGLKSALEAVLPKPPTLADELRDEARGIPEHSLPRYRIAAIADRVETLEQERDTAQAEIARLRAREIPDGWRIADHPEKGAVLAAESPHSDGYTHYAYLGTGLRNQVYRDWGAPDELKFRDEAPAPQPQPEHIDPKTCGQYDWYLVEHFGHERHGIRIAPKEAQDEWCVVSPSGQIDFGGDEGVTVIRPLTSEEMDAR